MTGFRSTLALAPFAVLAVIFSLSAPARAEERFTVSADGTEVLDTTTNLLWQRCAEGTKWDGKACTGKPALLKYGAAKESAAAVEKASGKPWRIPTKDELKGIVVKVKKKKPTIDVAAFPNTPPTLFWASREGFKDDLNAWLVSFGNGRVYGNTGERKFPLRLVRPNS